MAQAKTVVPGWADQEVPAGSPLPTGAVLTLRDKSGVVSETQSVPLKSGAVTFTVPAGTGWYVQGQTVAGTASVGDPVMSTPFDVVDLPITITVISSITVS